MKSICSWLIVILFFIATGSRLQAQSFWDYVEQYDVSYGAQYLRLKGFSRLDSAGIQEIPSSANFIGISGMIGFYFPVASLGTDMSFGIQPNASASIGRQLITDADGGGFARIGVPLFAIVKYGTDAEFFGKKPFGVGAGIGCDAQLIAISPMGGINGFYASPQLVLEASALSTTLGLVKLHFMASILPVTIDKPGASQSSYDNEFHGHLDFRSYSLYLSVNKKF